MLKLICPNGPWARGRKATCKIFTFMDTKKCPECGHAGAPTKYDPGYVMAERNAYGSVSQPVYQESLGEYTEGKSDFKRRCRDKGLDPG